jgi:hypothetical protein
MFVLGSALAAAGERESDHRQGHSRQPARRFGRPASSCSVIIVRSFLRPAGRVFEFDSGGVEFGQRVAQVAFGVERLAVDDQLLQQADLAGLPRLGGELLVVGRRRQHRALQARTRSRWLSSRLHRRLTWAWLSRVTAGTLDLSDVARRSAPGRWPRRCA